MNSAALNLYKSINVESGITDASPYKMIAMLFEGAMDKLSIVRGAIERGDSVQKGEQIGKVIAIVDGLRASLDYEKGGEIATNLGSLYDYMERRLLEANVSNDLAIVDEVYGLLSELKSGWDGISGEQKIPA